MKASTSDATAPTATEHATEARPGQRRQARLKAARWGRASTAVVVLALLTGLGSLLLLRTARAQTPVPPLTGRVVDNANLLSNAAETQLTGLLAAHEDSTSNQVAVLTIPSLQGAALEQYSLRVARAWALGQEDFNNGVLLLIARDDRKMRIEVGYGLEGDLPDAIASRIIRNEITPHFRKGDFEAGIRAGVGSILDALEGTYAPPEAPGASNSPVANRVLGAIFMVFGLLFGGGAATIILMTAARNGVVAWLVVLVLGGSFLAGGTVAAAAGLSFLIFGSVPDVAGAVLVLAVLPGAFIAVIAYSIALLRHPKLKAFRQKDKDERKLIDETVKVGFMTFTPSFWETATRSASSSGRLELGR